jgi:hypothetical protein
LIVSGEAIVLRVTPRARTSAWPGDGGAVATALPPVHSTASAIARQRPAARETGRIVRIIANV